MTKMGVSALCGTLAAMTAAKSADLSVAGTVDMSWMSFDDATTGNPLGLGSDYALSASGEMDNGWSVALSIAMKNKNIYSNTTATITIPALGDIRVDGGVSGTGIDRIDDVTPNVWEEAYGTGLGTGINTVGGSSAGSTIEYTPNMLPAGLTARLAYSPDADGATSNDKSSSGYAASVEGTGYDIMLQATSDLHGMDGLTLSAGMSKIEQDATASNMDGDQDEETWAITYAFGGFTVGYQYSEEDLGRSAGAQEYENTGYGITFNVNDDLSVGYNHYESEQTNSTNVTAKASSIQAAYTYGGATIRLAEATVDNAKYQTTAMYDKDATTLSVSLAF